MNRLVLIGNGFDLAHGLKTSYKDFVGWYWKNRIRSLLECYSGESRDSLCSFILDTQDDTWYSLMYKYEMTFSTPENVEELIERFDSPNIFRLEYFPLFERINKSIDTNKWVDIENEYYRFLSSWKYTYPTRPIKDLNKELDCIKERLAEYLADIQKNSLSNFDIINKIKEMMLAPIQSRELSVGAKHFLKDLVEIRLNYEKCDWECLWNRWCKKTSITKISMMPDVINDLRQQISSVGFDGLSDNQIPINFLLPDNMMILNFNYTEIADQYVKNTDFEVNHIHGELNKEDKMIFGYGDELDENYKKIQNLNDNEYLKNSKSVRYLESDNYRKMLTFIESEPYQIYIMGHSCGNSDRTLLNTLFEHKNCVSIKPFYYKKDDKTDTYLEIVQNISRNFTDMKLMRDRVVNKEYCDALPQVKDLRP